MTVSLPARLIVVLALGSYAGCTTFSPALGDIVRGPAAARLRRAQEQLARVAAMIAKRGDG